MKNIFKNKNVVLIFCGIAVGVLLILFGSIDSKEMAETDIQGSYPGNELESYTTSLENRVCEHVSKINGVSNVSVLITIEGTNEKVYATEGVGKDYVITKDSSGNENALILTEVNATIRGIAVVCDYGGNEELRQQIIIMLASLFDIGTNRISVMSA